MTGAAPYSIPKEPGGPSAAVFALVVHLMLLGFLWIGVSWQSQTPGGVEAEVWDVKYREAAPKEANEPGPVSTQEEPPQREIPVNKTPPPPVTRPVEKAPVAKPAVNKPDIALEQERKRQAEAKKKADEDKRKKKEEKKAAAEKLKQDKAALAAKKKQEQAERKAVAESRAAEMRRLTGKMGGAGRGGTGGQGTAARSTGDNRFASSYAKQIEAKIKSNTTYAVPAGLGGNPEVVYVVELLPDGTLRRPPTRKKSSGLPGFDQAVFRAIEKSAPFPRDKDGKVPKEITVTHKPKDL